MDKMLVVVLSDEKSAYEARNALLTLDQEGSISLYAAAVVAKDASGHVSVKLEGDQGPLGTMVGLLTGTLAGMAAGPVGAAVGATVGAYGGGMFDLVRVGIGTDFVDEVSGSLKAGNVAVIAEIDEDWVTPVDSRMEALGGEVFRRARSEVVDAQITSEQAALQQEIADMKAEAAKTTGEAKAKLQKRMDAANTRLKGLQSRSKAAFHSEKEQLDAKLRVLKDRAAKAKDEAKAGLQQRTRSCARRGSARGRARRSGEAPIPDDRRSRRRMVKRTSVRVVLALPVSAMIYLAALALAAAPSPVSHRETVERSATRSLTRFTTTPSSS